MVETRHALSLLGPGLGRGEHFQHGETTAGFITVVLERGETTLLFKNVPAQVCENCGEEYLSSDTNNGLLKRAQDAVARGVDFEMLRYAFLVTMKDMKSFLHVLHALHG